jgi:hypothetical protein
MGEQMLPGHGLLDAVLDEFLFQPEQWVEPESLVGWLKHHHMDAELWTDLMQPTELHQALSGDDSRWNPASIRRILSQLSLLSAMDLSYLTSNWHARLSLLSRTEWMRLGLCVSVLPSAGFIQRSLDGNFRRAVRQTLDESVLEALDAQASPTHKVLFLGGAGSWRNPERLAAGGVRAVIEQCCEWPDPVRERSLLRFSPSELRSPVSVSGLNIHWLEVSCRLLWPNHPWLWS